ncbi:hypothetical protein HRbin40_00983 [bacterium HR40]|nr:hypothetical protein HRbin40_00983 [bacterium HR40]
MQEFLGTSPAVFLGLTLFVTGLPAILAGRALGDSWRSPRQVVGACVGLALAHRFLVYALFGGPLLHLPGFVAALAPLLVLALTSWRIARVARMVQQYPWRYRRTSPFTYVELGPG